MTSITDKNRTSVTECHRKRQNELLLSELQIFQRSIQAGDHVGLVIVEKIRRGGRRAYKYVGSLKTRHSFSSVLGLYVRRKWLQSADWWEVFINRPAGGAIFPLLRISTIRFCIHIYFSTILLDIFDEI